MARTHRRHNFRTTRWACHEVAGQSWNGHFRPFEENSDIAKRHVLAILRGDDGRISYDKCKSARIDREGGWKLDTWDNSSNKHNNAHRRRRRADKILIKRQLEDY